MSEVSERWINMKEAWPDRMRVMSRFIKPNSSVVDIGAGLEKLYEFLPPGCEYTPCDVVKRTKRTIVCNINDHKYPEVKKHDYLILSGVIEYINDVDDLFSKLPLYSRRVILSYNPKDLTNPSDRDPSWVNAFTTKELLDLLNRNGYSIIRLKKYGLNQIIVYAEQADRFEVFLERARYSFI